MAVPISAVPGIAKYGGNFLAVTKYGGTDFGGSGTAKYGGNFPVVIKYGGTTFGGPGNT